jgi:hypothetical protein
MMAGTGAWRIAWAERVTLMEGFHAGTKEEPE